MVISSPGIYIFSRHNSVWWPNNINTMRTVMSKAFCRHFSIFRKFWIEMLTSTAQIHSSEVIDWIQIEWWPTSTSNWKFKFPSWHFGHRPCRRLIYIPTLSCHIPFFAPPPISPKSVDFTDLRFIAALLTPLNDDLIWAWIFRPLHLPVLNVLLSVWRGKCFRACSRLTDKTCVCIFAFRGDSAPSWWEYKKHFNMLTIKTKLKCPMIIKKDMLAFQANMIQNSWQNGFNFIYMCCV